jgi:hypothetical protein
MNDSHPLLGLLGAVFFLMVGTVAIRTPARLQDLARRYNEGKTWTRHWPFISFIDNPSYIPAMRVMGWAFVLMGMLLLVGSLLELFLNPRA